MCRPIGSSKEEKKDEERGNRSFKGSVFYTFCDGTSHFYSYRTILLQHGDGSDHSNTDDKCDQCGQGENIRVFECEEEQTWGRIKP